MQFVTSPTEQTTAVTDLILAFLALTCVFQLRPLQPQLRWKATLWACAFGLLSLASVLGAIAHGVQMLPATNWLLWQPIQLSLGLMVALFVVAAIYDYWGKRRARQALPWLLGVGGAFFVLTQISPTTILMFVIYESVALVGALLVYTRLALMLRLPGASWIVGGILLSIVAAGVQATRVVTFTWIWQFNHNGAFHLIQLAGLLCFIIGLRASLRRPTVAQTQAAARI